MTTSPLCPFTPRERTLFSSFPRLAVTLLTLAFLAVAMPSGAEPSASGLESAPSGAATTADNPKTFSHDVAPIFYEHCVSCHRTGEIAPMPLLTWEEARPWAKSIKRQVADRSMPPWHADSSLVEYSNDRRLSEAEVETIVGWVDAGAPEGDPGDKPPLPEFLDGWQLGEPDRVFETKTSFTVPVTDEEIPYQSVTFHIDVLEDLYLEAWEIRPSNLQVVHHANLVRTPGSLDGKSVGIASAVMKGGDYIGSYLPGHSWVRYPEGVAYKLPKGSQLGIQVHYVSQDEEVESSLSFGVHLANGRVDKVVRVVGTDYRDLDIPPHEPAYTIVDEIEILANARAITSGAHMHLRGAAFKMEAVKPDGTVELVTDVPKYDFNWQSNYVLADPVSMPQGTKLRVTTVWDNSAGNPYNPDPSARVNYGPWTNDEMINSWAHVILEDEHLGLAIEDGLIVSRYPDGKDVRQPFMIQSLPAAPTFKNNKEEFEAHDKAHDKSQAKAEGRK